MKISRKSTKSLPTSSARKFAKACSAKEKFSNKANTQRRKSYDEKNIKITKETSHEIKVNLLMKIQVIENNLKILINTETTLRETRAISTINQNQIFLHIFAKQLLDQKRNIHFRDEREDLEQ